MLTSEDFSRIAMVVRQELQATARTIEELKKDMVGIKQEIEGMKVDLTRVRAELTAIKADMGVSERDVKVIRKDVTMLTRIVDGEYLSLSQRVDQIENSDG